jgi:HEXXH motif-containing protein
MWAAHTLRRLSGSVQDEAPAWVHVGHLHAIAAAAAIRAGIDFRTRVPVRQGAAFLPTIGSAAVPTGLPWDAVEVSGRAGSIQVGAGEPAVHVPPPAADGATVDAPGWVGCRWLRPESAGLRLTLELDDLDPYRGLHGPVTPARLDPAAVDRWRRRLDDAWALLVRDHPVQARELAAGLASLVPAAHSGQFRPHSASAGDSFGSAVVSMPDDAIELAVTLVHEFQHTKLNGLLHLVPLYEEGGAAQLYAPWRDDPRPLGGLLQGAYAFFGVTRFWRTRRQHDVGPALDLAAFEFALWRRQTETALETLLAAPTLTRFGRPFVEGLAGTLKPWLDEPVPAQIAAAATAASQDHRAIWRAHHVSPDPAMVSAAAAAWRAGQPAPAGARRPGSAIRADPAAKWLDTRAVLARLRLVDPAGFDRYRRAPTEIGAQVAGATPADVAYTTGDLAAAERLYLAELAASPDRTSAWAGLGLTLAAGGRRAAAPLLEQPELVRAVRHDVLAGGGEPALPVHLAEWLAETAG